MKSDDPRNDAAAEWNALLDELDERHRDAQAMGGEKRIGRQHSKGRLTARERIPLLCDPDSFREIGALVGSAHPGGAPPVPADALVGGTGRIDGRSIVVMCEDFTVQGGSIGHGNHAKRLRLATIAEQEKIPLVLMLDGAGERATNALERYPFAPNDLQVLADLVGRVPVVTLVLGTSAGHGALSGVFADLILMSEGASLFAAGPPLVKAALGLDVTPEDLGGAEVHVVGSGLVHDVLDTEERACSAARRFLSYLPQNCDTRVARAETETSASRKIDDILEIVPRNPGRAYDMRKVLDRVVDDGTSFEVQAAFGPSMITAFARIGGFATLIVANQPKVTGGAITREAADKAAHFLRVARDFGLPVVFLSDNPGVMAGPEAERAGTLAAAARMYRAQRSLGAVKVHVTVRKAFGFGSSLMAMNPFDRQTATLAFPGISLGGVPAFGGARAAGSSAAEEAAVAESQDAAWVPADNGGYDRVIDPRELRNEIVRAFEIGADRI